MKIMIFGSGGVGGYFGARLAASGEDVRFIARGAHLDAMKNNGLHVTSALGDEHIETVSATDTVTDCGIADVVFVAVKLYDTDAAARAIRPAVGANTTLVSFQNGVSGGPILSDAYGTEHVIGGSSSIAARIAKPGVIEHTGTMALLAFGEGDGQATPRTQNLFDACVKAGIDVTLSDHIDGVIWSKFIFLAAFAGITCTFRKSIGPILEDSEKRGLFRNALEETFAIARARGVTLPDDLVDKRMDFADGLPAEMYSSMYHDLNAGKRLELPWLSGTVVDFGHDLGIDTPAHQSFVDALSSNVDGSPG
jgi:2-dehydropantoate 2-reductase